jgi:hypothetical protein
VDDGGLTGRYAQELGANPVRPLDFRRWEPEPRRVTVDAALRAGRGLQREGRANGSVLGKRAAPETKRGGPLARCRNQRGIAGRECTVGACLRPGHERVVQCRWQQRLSPRMTSDTAWRVPCF